jgi:hypothetical protein
MRKEEPSYYANIPANVRYDDRLCPNAKLMYGEITALSNRKGYCYANNQYFANLYKVTNRSIQNWISQLCDYGYLLIKYDGPQRQMMLYTKRLTMKKTSSRAMKKTSSIIIQDINSGVASPFGSAFDGSTESDGKAHLSDDGSRSLPSNDEQRNQKV